MGVEDVGVRAGVGDRAEEVAGVATEGVVGAGEDLVPVECGGQCLARQVERGCGVRELARAAHVRDRGLLAETRVGERDVGSRVGVVDGGHVDPDRFREGIRPDTICFMLLSHSVWYATYYREASSTGTSPLEHHIAGDGLKAIIGHISTLFRLLYHRLSSINCCREVTST